MDPAGALGPGRKGQTVSGRKEIARGKRIIKAL
jgi:hypothetical protein